MRKIETLIVLVTSTHLHLVLALGFHKVVTMCSLGCGPESGAIICFLDVFFSTSFPGKKKLSSIDFLPKDGAFLDQKRLGGALTA